MYTVSTRITGTAPLMQHRFPIPADVLSPNGGHRVSGARDYSQEWREYLYVTESGEIYQPAVHIETALVKTAKQFKIVGRRGKTYEELFKASVFISPDQILHGFHEPESLTADADQPMYLDVRPVVVNRARVIRLRPCIKDWQLAFEIQVIDDQIPTDLLNDVLTLAGRTAGLGEQRPRFGRFMVTEFTVHN